MLKEEEQKQSTFVITSHGLIYLESTQGPSKNKGRVRQEKKTNSDHAIKWLLNGCWKIESSKISQSIKLLDKNIYMRKFSVLILCHVTKHGGKEQEV